MTDSPTFSRASLPGGEWRSARKTTPTWMVRIDGPFTVETAEGPLRCEDGWVALDTNGDPYPIAADVEAASYKPTGDSFASSDPSLVVMLASDRSIAYGSDGRLLHDPSWMEE